MVGIFSGYLPSATAPTFDTAADIRAILQRSRYPLVNVLAYGALGDGVADDRAALVAAEAALGSSGGTLYLPAGTYRLATSLSLLRTTHLWLEAGAQLAPVVGMTLTVNGSITAPEAQVFGGLGAVVAPTQGVFWARWFGAKGDGTGDDGPAINRAILAAKGSRNATVIVGVGRFRVTTQVALTGAAGTGIALVGHPAPLTTQQGSVDAPCAIEWAGGATPAVAVTVSFTQISNLAVFNTGTGTAAFSFAPNGHAEIQRVSFAGPGGATAWSSAAIDSSGGLNYCRIAFCNFDVSPAIKVAGVHTTLEITNCVFDAIGANPAIDANGVQGDMISIHNSTFNSFFSTTSTFFDNSAATGTLGNLSIHECEFDCAAGAFQSFIAKLKNVWNFSFYNNEVSQYGNASNVLALIQLTAVARSFVWGNNLSSVNPKLVKCNDATSYVYVGANRFNIANTVGVLDAVGAAPGNVVAVAQSTAVVALHGETLDPGRPSLFVVNVANNTAFELRVATLADADVGLMAPGQLFWVRIRNASGGVMGAVTFRAEFKSSGAFTVPANGFSRTLTYYYDGTNAFELSRSAADVPN